MNDITVATKAITIVNKSKAVATNDQAVATTVLIRDQSRLPSRPISPIRCPNHKFYVKRIANDRVKFILSVPAPFASGEYISILER